MLARPVLKRDVVGKDPDGMAPGGASVTCGAMVPTGVVGLDGANGMYDGPLNEKGGMLCTVSDDCADCPDTLVDGGAVCR